MTDDTLLKFKSALDEVGKDISANNYDRLKIDRPPRTTLRRKYQKSWNELKAMALGDSPIEEKPAKHKLMADDEITAKLATMVGLKKKSIPAPYRNILASLIMETEYALERRPVVSIPERTCKEAVVLLGSDDHSGKRVFNEEGQIIYDKDILSYRKALLKTKVIHLLRDHLRKNTIDEFWLLLLGDLVDGSGIYPGQIINQDLTCFHNQVALVAASYWDIITAIRNYGLPVHVRGVRGNHGRQGKDAPADNNFDYAVYQLLYLWAYTTNGVDVDYSTTTQYMNVNIKGQTVHLRHEAPPQTETPASRAKLGGWRQIHEWEILVSAHLHHPGGGTYGPYYHIMNGSPVGIDDLSESMGRTSRPSQAFFGIAPNQGVSFRYDIYLDGYGEGQESEELMQDYPMLKEIEQ